MDTLATQHKSKAVVQIQVQEDHADIRLDQIVLIFVHL